MIAAAVGSNQVPIAAIGVPLLFTGSRPSAGEGEPASFKDRALIVLRPHPVLGGAVPGAEAITARTVHVAVHDAGVRGTLLRAIAGSPDSRRFRVHDSSAGDPGDTVAECG